MVAWGFDGETTEVQSSHHERGASLRGVFEIAVVGSP